jgi:S1-C subfamily serine protease
LTIQFHALLNCIPLVDLMYDRPASRYPKEFAMLQMVMIVAAAMIVLPQQSHAQTLNKLLRGLSKVQLVIEDLDSDSKGCGLSEEAVRASVMYPLSSTDIRVEPRVNVAFYVNISTLLIAADQRCTSSLRIRVYAYQTVTLNFSGDEKYAEVTLWNSTSIHSSGRAPHARQIADAIESRAKKFITDWNLDNKALATPQNGDSDSKKQTISMGTAFAVTQSGDLVTNEHVVSKCSTVAVKQGKHYYVGRIAFRESVADLAVIKLTTKPENMSYARLRQSPELKAGDPAIAYGFPLLGSLADEGNLTVGNVSALRGLKNDANYIQISAPVQPGNSGGPLLDSSGNLIGVVSSKLDALNALARSGDLPQNVNFAINLSVLKDFLTRAGVRVTEATSRFEVRPDEVGDRAKGFTYSVECDPRSAAATSVVAAQSRNFMAASPDGGKPAPEGASSDDAISYAQKRAAIAYNTVVTVKRVKPCRQFFKVSAPLRRMRWPLPWHSAHMVALAPSER